MEYNREDDILARNQDYLGLGVVGSGPGSGSGRVSQTEGAKLPRSLSIYPALFYFCYFGYYFGSSATLSGCFVIISL